MHKKFIKFSKRSNYFFSKDLILVIVQFGLIILHFISIDYSIINKDLTGTKFLGLGVVSFGLILISISLITLGRNLSPFPIPREKGNLITNGIYSRIRHPMYFGLISISTGNCFINSSFMKVILTLLLMIVISIKIKIEEQYLLLRFANYSMYKTKVKL